MTKIILIAFILSIPSYAQNVDELTLESSTSPMVVEDGSDLVEAPAEAPAETPAATPALPDISTTNVNPEKDVPAVIPDSTEAVENPKFDEPTEISEVEQIPEPTESTEMTSSVAEEPKGEEPLEITSAPATEVVQTPNPLEKTSKKPEDSTPLISTERPYDARRVNHYKSHWITTLAFEGLKYELPFDFEGERRNVRDRNEELYGARFGFGGQLKLIGGLFTTSKIETYYVGTLTKTVQVADPDVEDEEAGSIKRTGNLWGGDLSQNLGYIFEFRTKNPFMDEWAYLTFEPFVEAGIGVAQAYNAVNYEYDTGATSANQVREKYKRRIRDNLTNARIGAGFNITGGTGFFMTAKVSVNRYNITNREVDTYRQQDNQAGTSEPSEDLEKDVKLDPITVITIGGGYKF